MTGKKLIAQAMSHRHHSDAQVLGFKITHLITIFPGNANECYILEQIIRIQYKSARNFFCGNVRFFEEV